MLNDQELLELQEFQQERAAFQQYTQQQANMRPQAFQAHSNSQSATEEHNAFGRQRPSDPDVVMHAA